MPWSFVDDESGIGDGLAAGEGDIAPGLDQYRVAGDGAAGDLGAGGVRALGGGDTLQEVAAGVMAFGHGAVGDGGVLQGECSQNHLAAR